VFDSKAFIINDTLCNFELAPTAAKSKFWEINAN
jgi:hypothetical protein